MSETVNTREATALGSTSTHLVRDDSMSSASIAQSSSHRCSTPSTSLQDQSPPTNDSIPLYNAPSDSAKNHVHRRTLSWRKLPKEFNITSLLRSRSTSVRRRSPLDLAVLQRGEAHTHGNMLAQPLPSPVASGSQRHRSTKRSENRFYNFISRSRSRPRQENSNTRSRSVEPSQTTVSAPQAQHVRHASASATPNSPPSTSATRPPSPLRHSRPLSSTTANTHSTITSLPPTFGRRNNLNNGKTAARPQAICVVAPPSLDEIVTNGTTDKHATAHAHFVAHTPDTAHSNLAQQTRSTAKSSDQGSHGKRGGALARFGALFGFGANSAGFAPRPSAGSTSTPKMKRNSLPASPMVAPRNIPTVERSQSPAPAPGSLDVRKSHFWSSSRRSSLNAASSEANHRPISISAPPTPQVLGISISPVLEHSSSSPIEVPKPKNDKRRSSSLAVEDPTVSPSTRKVDETPRSTPLPGSGPRIIRTSPTPQKPRSGSEQNHDRHRRSGHGRLSPTLFLSRVPSPPLQLSRTDSRRSVRELGVSMPMNAQLHSHSLGSRVHLGEQPHTDPSLSKKVKKSRHGSFDFERPLSGPFVSTRSISGSTAGRSRESLHAPPPRPGSQRGRAGSREEVPLNSKTANGRNQPYYHPTVPPQRTASHDHKRVSATETMAQSTSSAVGKSQSWGRASGKRVGLNLNHGSFDFESPVPPSPTNKDLGLHGSIHAPRRSGRSVDLGIGLSWAPTSVKEEAVMDGFRLRREESTSTRGGGVTAPASQSSHRRSASHDNKANGTSRVGSGLTEVFRAVLTEAGFASFKKYVRRFDAHKIPFDGTTGLVARVQKLINEEAPKLDIQEKRDLLDSFVQLVLYNM